MSTYESYLTVDGITYITLALALKTFNPNILKQLKCIREITSNVVNLEDEHLTVHAGYFMGIVSLKFLQQETACISFKMDEISVFGVGTGITFRLDFNKETTNAWLSNPIITSIPSDENLLLIFKSVPRSEKKEILFFLDPPNGDVLFIKHFKNTNVVGIANQQYLRLAEAAAKKASKCNVFGVVRKIVKKPATTRRGTGHGIFTLVDRSCYYDGTLINQEFNVQIFASSMLVFPTIELGDVLKLNEVSTEPMLRNPNKIEFRAIRDHHVVVFPNGHDHREGPYCPEICFPLTSEDFQAAEDLKLWYEEIKHANIRPTRMDHPVGKPAGFQIDPFVQCPVTSSHKSPTETTESLIENSINRSLEQPSERRPPSVASVGEREFTQGVTARAARAAVIHSFDHEIDQSMGDLSVDSSTERQMRELPSNELVPEIPLSANYSVMLEERLIDLKNLFPTLELSRQREVYSSLASLVESAKDSLLKAFQASTPSFCEIVTSTQKEGEDSSNTDVILIPNCTPNLNSPRKENMIISNSSLYCDDESVRSLTRCSNISDMEAIFSDLAYGSRFQVSARIVSILPSCPVEVTPFSLSHLIVAFCMECKRLFHYEHFKDSISKKNFVSRRIPKTPTPSNDEVEPTDTDKVTNFLCSEEEYVSNMTLLANSDDVDLSRYECDEDVFIDRSFSFVCPVCKLSNLPDVLCQLQPTFLFSLHLSKFKQPSSPTEESCLHVKACGIHAEYFLGTRTDHVLRSPEVWQRAENRLVKLMKSHQPLRLSVRRHQESENEVYLENTYVVYSNYHVLPFD